MDHTCEGAMLECPSATFGLQLHGVPQVLETMFGEMVQAMWLACPSRLRRRVVC